MAETEKITNFSGLHVHENLLTRTNAMYLWHRQLTSCELQTTEDLFSESEKPPRGISRIPQLF